MDDRPDYIHPDYEKAAPIWQKCRDAIEGQEAVHARGEAYLPRLTEQNFAEYDAYKRRTPYYAASGRTADGLVGMVFRKEPEIETPAAMQGYIDDMTLSGIDASELSRMVLHEIVQTGRVGVLVEYPRVAEQPSNLAAATELNLRPYASVYKAESIINWRVERRNNKMMATLVVLSEVYEQAGIFATSYQDQLRVLTLREGFYQQQIWRKAKDGGDFELIDEITPTKNGAPLREIPFFAFGVEELSLSIQQPPLLDLCNLNLSHYRTNADLEHGAHFTGLPTPFIAGLQLGENEKISIGSAIAILAPDPQAKASYLEFTGQGLGALEKLLDRKEAQMAAIGARMLAPEKAGVEAVETVQIRNSGETSVLASLANLISRGMNNVLEFMRDWSGIAGTCVFRLNTDFMPVKMTAPELTALVGAWQSGAISMPTLFHNLKQGEIVAEDRTLEDEQSDLALEAPQLTKSDGDGNSE